MPAKPAKILRCAIYTRKSTDHGLDLEFNSLDAQREACEAYVKSQASEGWRPLPDRYDDAAYSGGNLERPGVKKLLKDIEAGRVDVVVVYKIDRLTRSLADFAKLVEVFDAKKVSFVAITQQFNTTTSMGRLTLNVLLSFAQFERELASERVRDKIAASRKKGKWTGGSVPLGYDTKDKRLVVNPAEARTVRLIFERYLALKSFQKVIDELNRRRIVTKLRPIKDRVSGGVPFTFGPLAYLLRNRTYLGETGHAGKWFLGEHEAILDRSTFDAVQELLKTNGAGRRGRRQQVGSLLAGLLYDDRGNRMSPTYTTKNGFRYLFYVSSNLLKGRKDNVGSVARVSATGIEQTVLGALRKLLASDERFGGLTPRDLLERTIERLVVRPDRLTLTLKPELSSTPIEIPWAAPPAYVPPKIEGDTDTASKPDEALVQAIARAHAWLDLLIAGTYESIEELAAAVGVHPKVVRNRIRLAFLSPAITRASLSGEQLEQVTLADLNGPIPPNWRKQNGALPTSPSSHLVHR
jgi:DNA invertase Pin-like site-specific DNA recombinase